MQFPPTNPGVAASVLEFLHTHDAALLGWDLMEAPEQGYPDRNPIHSVAIPHMGLPLLDNASFQRLSEQCAASRRYEFLFSVAPLVVVGGTGSPVNPIATF
jgi:kynurenine formamidase